MKTRKMDIGSKDLISSLPDALVGHILSFLSTKDAALTSVLSKRWRFLLAVVPNLDFDTSTYNHPKTRKPERKLMLTSFKVFVDRVMALQGNAPLNKFSLKCRIRRGPSPVDGWISNVLKRGVLDLDLCICSDYDYRLLSGVVISKTLVKLKVGGKVEFIINVGDVFLPKLKTLYLHDDVVFEETGAAFAKLISRCSVLEELVMIKVKWDFWESCVVSNPTLKRLTIHCKNIDENPENVSFDTPNLVYLEFTDTVALKYPKVNFDSLVEASLGLRMTPAQLSEARDSADANEEEDDMVGNAADFLMGMSNVKILYLSSDTLEVLTFCCKAIPVFNNLIQLTIETDQEVGWESLPSLLENCPNLETLVFEGLHYRDTKHCWEERHRFNSTNECLEDEHRCVCKPWEGTPIWLSSSPVKTLKVLKFGEITNYKDDMDKQTDLVKYLVESMPNLEQVILYYDTVIDGDLSIVSAGFEMLEKVASPKCRIQVISDNISFSSTVGSSSSTSGLVFFKNTFPV